MRHPSLQQSVKRALVRHALLTGLVAVVLSGVMVAGVWKIAQNESLRTAQQVSTQVASAMTVALSARDYRQTQPDRRSEMLRGIAPFVDSGMVHRVKVWLVDGQQARVVFSDEARIEGHVREFNAELARRLDAGEAVTEPVPRDAEHRFETEGDRQLVEVYIGFTDTAGNAMRLEVYVPVDAAATSRHALAVLLPVMLAGLLLLGALTVPLTVALARRMERDRAERHAALRYGLAASELERRELARQLHDGVIQDLAGTGLLLDALRGAADRPASPHQTLLDRAHRLVEQDVRVLRSLATELFPLPVGADLHAAIVDLVDQLRAGASAPTIDVNVEPGEPHDPTTVTLLHQVARELLRNALRHSGADHIDVHVGQTGRAVQLAIADNGFGFDPDRPAGTHHLGLRLVRRTVEDVGGSLTLASAPGAGTTATATIPWPLSTPP